ncbi:MAG: 3-hydroxybutyryl-CoA dehydrogenase [Aquificota bacterium]|nr:MAG: 3-hydroxybutyryl-CoA dehydrogenase [Aquificota bacterium]
MKPEDIRKIGVVGAGTMGNGIAQVCAMAGYQVVMGDVTIELAQKGLNTISKNIDRLVKKEKLTPEGKEEILGRIQLTEKLDDLADVDLAIEAVTENIEIKEEVFKTLDSLCRPEVILASNTSSISITKIATFTNRPDKVIGMHFMNPVPVMKLIEVIEGLQTSRETSELVVALSEKLGKVPVVIKDSPGFVSNRVLMPMINEAIFALYEGVGSPEAIDTIMKLGANHPMGPLALADLIGLDTTLYILQVMYDSFGDPKYRPCPLLVKMVDAGYLGRKVGKGFYEYTK